MEVTAKELRIHPGKIIELVSRGIEVIITYRGKKLAKLIPFEEDLVTHENGTDEIFGLWKNHPAALSVEEEVRSARKGRKF